jgi:hypothetical protein
MGAAAGGLAQCRRSLFRTSQTSNPPVLSRNRFLFSLICWDPTYGSRPPSARSRRCGRLRAGPGTVWSARVSGIAGSLPARGLGGLCCTQAAASPKTKAKQVRENLGTSKAIFGSLFRRRNDSTGLTPSRFALATGPFSCWPQAMASYFCFCFGVSRMRRRRPS